MKGTRAEKLKELRVSRNWTQDHLADISRVSIRTIQRIENGAQASADSIEALARALDVPPSELNGCEPEPAVQPPEAKLLVRLTTGQHLVALVADTHMFSFNHAEVIEPADVEAIAAFLQEVQDYGDIYSELEAGERVRAAARLGELIRQLDEQGFWVFGLIDSMEKFGSLPGPWSVARLYVARSTDPSIIDWSAVAAAVHA